MTNGQTPKKPTVLIHRCRSGHAFFYSHELCPVCNEPLHPLEVPARARLVAGTTVHVTPSGELLRLGLAELAEGARTLCTLGADTEPGSSEEVVLRLEGGIYRAESA